MINQDEINTVVFRFVKNGAKISGKELFKLMKALDKFIETHFLEKESGKFFTQKYNDAIRATNDGKDNNDKDFIPYLGADGKMTFTPYIADDPLTKEEKVVIPTDKYMRTFKKQAKKFGIDYSLVTQRIAPDGKFLTRDELKNDSRVCTLYLRGQQISKVPLFIEGYIKAVAKMEEKEKNKERKESVRGKLENFRKRPVKDVREQIKDHAEQSR